jgi:MYXO-CTERM domain-containing protein
MAFSASASGDLIVSGDGFAPFLYAIDPLVYHQYSFICDAVLDAVAFWVNGAEVAANIPGVSSTGSSGAIYFGNSAESITYSHWHEVTVAIIPEPAVVGVGLGLGALAGALARRRRTEKARGVWRDLFPLV